MTPPAKPKVLHVYRGTVTGNLSVSEGPLAKRDLGYREHLGEYAPRGPVVAEWWEVHTNSFSPFVALSRESASSMADHYASSGINTRIVHVVRRKVCR